MQRTILSDHTKSKNEISEIIFYDFYKIEPLSFYIDGFLTNQKKYKYKFIVKSERPSFFNQLSYSKEEEDHFFRLGIFEYKGKNERFFFCIDRSDHSDNYMNEGYIIPILKIVKFYFKANFNPDAINNDPEIKKYVDKIVPIGLSFPVCTGRIINFFIRIFTENMFRWNFQFFKERLYVLLRVPALNYLRRNRRIKPDLNLFFVVRYYSNQPKLNEYRYEVLKAIENLGIPKTILGFVTNTQIPEKFEHYRRPRFKMREYYRNLARSKVAIYVRGPHNGISSKLGQLLALGKPIIGQTIYNNKELYYQNQFFNEQFSYDEPEEIAQHVHELLQQPEKLASYSKANANAFDTKLDPEITVSRIIDKLLILN